MRMTPFVPVLGLLVACGDNFHPGKDLLTETSDDAEPTSDDDTDTPAARQIGASFSYEPNDCDDHSVRFTARVFYADDGSLVDNAVCQYMLDDGTEVFGCSAVLSVAGAHNVVLTARDQLTGEIAHHEEVVTGPESFDATFDVTSDGLTIFWDVHTLYGTVEDVGGVEVSVDPLDDVVAGPAYTSDLQGSVTVSQPGTYTLQLSAFLSFGEVGGCVREVEKTIDVCHHHDHVHH